MNHWLYIAAAYAIVAGGTAGLSAWSYVAMRRAERRADEITKR